MPHLGYKKISVISNIELGFHSCEKVVSKSCHDYSVLALSSVTETTPYIATQQPCPYILKRKYNNIFLNTIFRFYFFHLSVFKLEDLINYPTSYPRVCRKPKSAEKIGNARFTLNPVVTIVQCTLHILPKRKLCVSVLTMDLVLL